MQSEGLLHHIEITAKRARFNARKACGQGASPTIEDIERAISDMMPHAPRQTYCRSLEIPLPPLRGACSRPPRRPRATDSQPSLHSLSLATDGCLQLNFEKAAPPRPFSFTPPFRTSGIDFRENFSARLHGFGCFQLPPLARENHDALQGFRDAVARYSLTLNSSIP
jgi:hypothetical protein